MRIENECGDLEGEVRDAKIKQIEAEIETRKKKKRWQRVVYM